MRRFCRIGMAPRKFAGLGFVLSCTALIQAAQAAPQSASPDPLPKTIIFNRDIRPILSDKCFKCHGPGIQQANLRFDLEEPAKHQLNGGRFAIVPGDPAKSQLMQRITATDPAVRMPKNQGGAAPGEPLTEREIALLRRWIEQGAPWQKHWAFIPPTPPAIPKVNDAKWVRNPIDAFVLHRLESQGLRPSPEAERATLLRRVTLDLTGLPPTPAELDIFLADISANAYEKVVDRLLQSSAYGERMTFPWLEAARYADSNGYNADGQRFMWRWRDWVINAFNSNMPYSQFIIEQLAGDMLPNATLDQKIASGFNRNNRANAEGGVIAEEYLVENVVDRVDVTSTVFLGLTIGCARCHNHKYDPITQKEFYQLYAYFDNVPTEFGRARKDGNSPPFIAAPTPDQQRQLKQLDDEVAAATGKWNQLQPDLMRVQRAWERELDSSTPRAWGPASGLVAYYPLDGNVSPAISVLQPKPDNTKASRRQGIVAANPQEKPNPPSFAPGRIGQAASFDGSSFISAGDIAGFASHVPDYASDLATTVSYDDPYTIAAWIYPTSASGAIVTRAGALVEGALTSDPFGQSLNLRDGKLRYNYWDSTDEGIRLESEKTVSLNQWHHVALTYDGSRWARGFKLFVDGKEWKWGKVLQDDMNVSALAQREPLRIGADGGTQYRFHGLIDEVRIYNRVLTSVELVMLADPTPISEIAALPEDQRNPGQIEKIRDYFIEHAAPANIREARRHLLEVRDRRDVFYRDLPTVMVMQESPTQRETHLLIRGAYDKPGEVVTRALPSQLESSPTAYPPNRLGLAQWLVDPSNPLTARVAVNRFWQMYFGQGIVKTSEDFGSQGDPPSHPDLLDWLATEFVRTGWDVKALQKTIVMSATYRQASRITPELLEKDPENRLLARGPSVRLTADIIRDQALAVSGLLINKIGGPSVKPYQPEGLWTETSQTSKSYVQDHGDKLYRRSLYTFWRRTIPPPSMANFDASSRENHVVRPVITNTPLQALDLMNDVVYLEAARALAERVMKEGGTTPPQRITYAFRLTTTRLPNRAESTVLSDAFRDDLESFQAKPGSALKYVSHGEHAVDEHLDVNELAAYTSLMSLILNLNETIMKE
jgi:Protein of unknown function (DUF1553)/Protein of unknown function (DUF1549)/Concanavalin A-like lectin/glucanases superfamily/Planctomycete cytochrome C